jgi:hypothetical protein
MGLAVLQAEVVVARHVIDVPSQVVLLAEQPVDRPRGVEQGGQGVVGGEATIVFGVERQ